MENLLLTIMGIMTLMLWLQGSRMKHLERDVERALSFHNDTLESHNHILRELNNKMEELNHGNNR